MTSVRIFAFTIALIGFVASPVQAQVGPGETDATKIMNAVSDRETADTFTSTMTMKIEDKSGRVRERALQVRSMGFDLGTRLLMIFASPADVKNTALLSVDYEDGQKDDDQWLYLPSLRKSTRIASTQKSGSFMGTDFSFADITTSDPKQFAYKMLETSVKAGGEDCWLIESRPVADKAIRETGYVKTNIWVSKEKLMPVQVKAWVKAGKKLKYMKFAEIKKEGNFWVAHRLTAVTKRGGQLESKTTLLYQEMKINDPTVTEADFSQRRMEKGI